jgi:uncharacterized protein (DUF2141 family)
MKYSLLLVIVLLVASLQCARQTTPTGGPRDSIPPVLINSIPADEATGYKGERIELTFNEAVTLNNPREQLLITPTVGKDFEMTVRKNTVYLELNTGLRDSTTYTINFRESIQDITEKNPAPNLQIAVSTGSYIDSLSIHGYVYQLLRSMPVENAAVALYLDRDTFNIFAHTPEYLTLTDKNGVFHFENLKPAVYYMYAFSDKNRNIVVDSRTEQYGFLRDAVLLTPGYDTFLEIPILSLDTRKLRLISARPYNSYFNIRTSKSVDSYSIKPVSPDDSVLLHHSFGDDQANVRIYMPEIKSDSIGVRFTARDSLGYLLDTLLYPKLAPRESAQEPFVVTAEKATLPLDNYILLSRAFSNKPIRAVTYDSILFLLDSLTTIPISPADITIEGQTRLILRKPISPELFPGQFTDAAGQEDFRSARPKQSDTQINKLRFGQSAFISIENDSSKRMEVDVDILRPDNTGIIIVRAETEEPHFILQLLNKDYSINQSHVNQKNITFRNLRPGDYMLNLVIDRNNNQRWDAGNFFLREEPEPITFYKNDEGQTAINIKANWELGPLLITYPPGVENNGITPPR